MSWRDNLRPASFRGVAFKVDGHEFSTGRRGQQHEYPQRDKPYFEDLGRKSRDLTIDAYVIGDDYMIVRDRLISACETKGPGALVHPFLGSIDVVCTDCRVSERVNEGRMARFSLSFVEAGEIRFPTESVDTSSAVSGRAASLISAAQDSFSDTYAVSGLPGFVADSAEDAGQSLADSISVLDASSGTLEAVDDFVLELPTLVRSPSGFASGISDLVATAALSASNPAKAMQSLSAFAVDTSGIPITTATRIQQAANLDSITSIVRRVALSNEAIALASIDFDSYQDAMARMQNFVGRVESEIVNGPSQANDTTYLAMDALRAAVVNDIKSRSGSLARITTKTAPDLEPALVTAYELYEDATRDAELISRNGIRHPSFIPPSRALEVLSS